MNSTSCFRTCLTQRSSEGNNRPTSNEIETALIETENTKCVFDTCQKQEERKKRESANLERKDTCSHNKKVSEITEHTADVLFF